MTTEKRKRGRPPGTGKQDMPLLREIARLMVAEPRLGVATALKRLRRKPNAPSPADIRRVQIKFKEHGPALLADARARPAPVVRTSRASTSSGIWASFAQLDQLASAQKRMEEAMGISTALYRSVRDITDNPVLRAQRELQDKMQSVVFALESPTDRLLRQMRDNPYERMMRSVRGIGGFGRY